MNRRRVATDVAVPIVAAAVPTAAFQLPNLFVGPGIRVGLVIAGLLTLAAVVVFQVRRGTAASASSDDLALTIEAIERQQELTMQYAFGQIATRLARFASLPPSDRPAELGAFADRIASALAFYLLADVPAVRANVYAISEDFQRLDPIGHGGAADSASAFRAGTAAGDWNLRWVRERGPRRIVTDRRADDRFDDDPLVAPRYRSYASVVIDNGDRPFGMLTVDSPAAGAFADSDVQSVTVMAAFMAVAFALVSPTKHQENPDERTRIDDHADCRRPDIS